MDESKLNGEFLSKYVKKFFLVMKIGENLSQN